MRRMEMAGAIHEVVEQAAMPGLPWIQAHLEAEPPIRIPGMLTIAACANMHTADEILVAICRAQFLFGLRPCGADWPRRTMR